MKRKEKLVRKFLPCALLDYTGLQDWLNEQAKAGYALAHWPKFTFVGQVAFRRDPAAVHSRYCLDPIGEWISEVELRNRADSYAAFGWQYVTRIGRLYAIYRCDDPTAQNLYSDPESLAWAMKKQVRLAWGSLIFWILWVAVLLRDLWPALLFRPAEVGMELILRAEILIPLYGIMLALVIAALSGGIGVFRGVRRVRAYLRQGQWPPAGPRHYPEVRRTLGIGILVGLLVCFLVYLGLSGARHTVKLPGEETWDFPHVTLSETLPAGTTLREYSPQELLHSDTFDHSFLAPEQYDVAQGGMTTAADGTQQDTRLYQESVRTISPALAHAVYRGRVEAHRHSLEQYRENWEENTATLHSNFPNAYDFMQEEEVSYPGLDALTCFYYQFSDETTLNLVYIGRKDDRVFVLNGSGDVDGEAALELLVQRLAEE